MGQLVFQANLGGAVNLAGPNTASTVTFTLPSADGTNGQALVTNGSGTLSFSSFVSAAAGSNTQVQFNSSGAFGASANLTFDGTTLTSTGFSGPHNGTVGATTPNTGAFTTLSASSTVTLSGGTANGVAYLNGSKVLTTGSALQFNGTDFGLGGTPVSVGVAGMPAYAALSSTSGRSGAFYWQDTGANNVAYSYFFGSVFQFGTSTNHPIAFMQSGSEQMRLTSTGLGIGTSSPAFKLDVNGVSAVRAGNALRLYRTDNAIYTELWDAGSSGFTVNNANGNGIRLQLAGSTAVTLDSSGNLGIGTSSPGDKLEIGGAGAGIILASPNGTRYRLTVTNLGTLSIAAV